ncbi:STAS domain-containing protein [Sunxiuqinia indica]|uniref:STAS domain-containing protein n=1 Tax=Sunxiuqinia indica TaxID=2692584 RepID=UPI00135691C7|nr:STAS domain-containing protein [Sunxiuqinia indica]
MHEVKVDMVEGGEGGVINFSGDLIFEDIRRIKEQVDAVLSEWNRKKLSIRISGVTSFDLSFLQLLEGIAAYLEKREIELNVEWNMDDETRLLLEHTGFEKYT